MRPDWWRAAVLGTALTLPACGIGDAIQEALLVGPSIPPPAPQDCATLSSLSWAVDGHLASTDAQVAVGASRRFGITPTVESQCEGSLVSMTWHLDDASVASLAPDGRSVWVTGVSPGLAYLGARLVFGDGAEVEAQERAIRVVPPEAPPQGSLLIIEGDLTIPSFGSGQDWNGWVPFTTTTTGRIDVSVNWISPQCEIWVRGNEGHCNAPGGCGTLVMIARDTGVRPLTATFDDPRMPPGDYTLHFENRSLHEETVHYEVRLTPN